jgi:hypothetical protein
MEASTTGDSAGVMWGRLMLGELLELGVHAFRLLTHIQQAGQVLG